MSLIIGLIAPKLAGKDTVAEYLAQKYDFVSFAAGHMLKDILLLIGQEVSRENETKLAVSLRQAFGEEVLNSAILARFKNNQTPRGLINGIRKPQEFAEAKHNGVRTVFISATDENRYARYQIRGEKKDDGLLNFADFLKQDLESPTEKDIQNIGTQAEFILENNGGLEELHANIDVLMTKLLKEQ